jgi:hypothetical protein
MKKQILYKFLGLTILLSLLGYSAMSQVKEANIYYITCDTSIFRFEIEKGTYSFTIKYYSPVTDTVKGIITIASIDDVVSRTIAIKRVMSILDNNLANKIADILHSSYKSRQNKKELNYKADLAESDKGAFVGVVDLRRTRANAYLISRKETDKQAFKFAKKKIHTQLKTLKKEKRKNNHLLAQADGNDSNKNFKNNTLSDSINKKLSLLSKNEIEIKNSFLGTFKGNHFVQMKRFYKNFPDSLKRKIIQLEVDSSDISFESGIIKDVYVTTHLAQDITKNTKFCFSNYGYIPFRNAQDVDAISTKGKNYLAFLYSNDSMMVLDMSDVINYNRKIPFSSGTYIPKDTTITITNQENGFIRMFKPSISENFDIRIYTDALGYGSGKAPNGIVQTEIQLKLSLNEGKNRFTLFRIWRKTDVPKNKPLHRSQIAFFNEISPYFRITKIEKTNNRLLVDNNSKEGDLLDLFKYSHLNVGTELNIATMRSDSKLFTFNTSGGILRTLVGNDSIESNNKELSTLYLNPSFNFQFFESNKIDFNFRVGGYFAWVVSPLDSTDLVNIKSNLKNYTYDKSHYWVEFQQSLNYHPRGERQNSIFLRASQYVSIKNNYFTIQAGYSAPFSNLFKF